MRNLIHLTVFSLMAATGVVAQQGPCPGGVDYWPDVDNCQFYYDCRSVPPIHQQCPEGLYWNQELTTCDYPDNVPDCEGGTRPPIGTVPTTTTSAPVTTTESNSPSTENPVSTTTTTATSTTPRPTTDGPLPTDCPPTGEHQLPYPGDCSIYTKCVDGFPILLRCPTGTLFDTRERICKPESEAVCDVRSLV